MAVRKWSVSVEANLAERVEGRVGGRGLSGFVARAVQHELERDLLDDYLGDLDTEFGAVPDDTIERYASQWPS